MGKNLSYLALEVFLIPKSLIRAARTAFIQMIGTKKITIRLLVMADGVGGWKNYQVDPAEYSRDLCKNIRDNFLHFESYLKIKNQNYKRQTLCDYGTNYEEIESDYNDGNKIVKKLLIKSANNLKSNGSSTCTILMLDKLNKKLFSTLIGDSGYMILRFDHCLKKYFKFFKSEDLMHEEYFNTPYQVGNGGDNPNKAITYNHDIINRDLIILASDG